MMRETRFISVPIAHLLPGFASLMESMIFFVDPLKIAERNDFVGAFRMNDNIYVRIRSLNTFDIRHGKFFVN